MQPDVCLTVVLDEADNFLVIKRSKRSTNAGRWEPPVGHREPGESPEDAALREVAEETGLSVQLLSGTTDKRSDDGGGLRLFLARANGTKPEVKTEPSEHDAHKWLTLDEMNALEDCHDSLKADISKLLKANSQTKEANMLPIAGQSAGVPFAPRFSGTYQPKLSGPPNPLASVKAPAVAKADTAGVQQALAKTGSMCPSATGEGKKMYKVNPEDTAIGEKAFESLDRFKRAGLNSFQASFFSRMVNEGRSASHIKQAIAVAGKQFGTKVANELQEGFNKLAFAFDATTALPPTLPNASGLPSSKFKPFDAVPDKFQPKSNLDPLHKSKLPPQQSYTTLYGKNKPIGPYDPSNIRAGGGRNFERNYVDKLQQYYNPRSEQWQQETYLPEDSWNKFLSRAGASVPTAIASYFGLKNPLIGGTVSGLGGSMYANHLAGENLKENLAGPLEQANQTFAGVKDLTSQLNNPNSELSQGYMSSLRDKIFEDARIKNLMQLADKATTGNGLIPSSDELINKMLENPKLKPLFDLAEKANSGGGFDLAGMFAKNQNWLIPLLAATAVGGLGGGALGGTGGALGGAIGLPLIYYLMQNPDAMNQLMGGAQTARKPPAAPPAAPPQQKWHAPMRLPAAPPVAPPTAPPVAPPAAPPPA